MAATAFNKLLSLALSRPYPIAHVVKPHIKVILVHPISKRPSDQAIQVPDVIPLSKGSRIVPVLLARGDRGKPSSTATASSSAGSRISRFTTDASKAGGGGAGLSGSFGFGMFSGEPAHALTA